MKLARRDFLKTMAAGAVLPGEALLSRAASPNELGQPPRDPDELFDRAIVIDSLCVVGGATRQFEAEDWDAIPRSGYTAIQTTLSSNNLNTALRALTEWRNWFDEFPDRLIRVTRAEHIEQAKREGKLGVMLGFQNTTMIEQDVANVDTLYALGTRCIQLTYNSRNLVGDGCTERTSAGLSDFGVEAVERMNDLGIIVDLSHCGTGTTADAIALSKRPPAFTHTVAQSIYSDTIRHPRAKTDEELRALADKGGVAAMATLGYFIGPTADVTIENYLDHIDHTVNVMGIDHVGVCTDHQLRGLAGWATRENWYEPRLRSFKPSYNVRWPPNIEGLDEPERFRNVAHGLDRRGYSTGDIEKILGQNWMWYFREILGG